MLRFSSFLQPKIYVDQKTHIFTNKKFECFDLRKFLVAGRRKIGARSFWPKLNRDKETFTKNSLKINSQFSEGTKEIYTDNFMNNCEITPRKAFLVAF